MAINRLSEYIRGMTMTRQLLQEARIRLDEGKDSKALSYLIEAFDSFVKATSCVVSLRSGVKTRGKK